jgi:hypothetical protein
MHSKRLDLTNYIKDLESRVGQEPNELIRYQIQEYSDFVQKLISIANIMDKKFFIVVPQPLPPTELSGGGLFSGIFGNPNVHLQVPLKKFLKVKEELVQRSNVIISGLSSMGITAQILSTKQTIELFYKTYNPDDAAKESLGDNAAPIGVEQAPQQGPEIKEVQKT